MKPVRPVKSAASRLVSGSACVQKSRRPDIVGAMKALTIAFATIVLQPIESRADVDVCWRPTIVRGVGSPLGCSPNEDYNAGLCYDPCASGQTGIGPACYGSCPEGYRNDPFHCGKSTHVRGVGSPLPCDSDEEQDAGLCYPRCPSGYEGVGPVCWQHCPAGFADIGVSCEKPRQARGVGRVVHQCREGETQDAGLCYSACGAGYVGVGPVCWRTCPEEFPVNCGAACAKSNGACASSTGSQTIQSLTAVIKLIMEDFKGAADAGTKAAQSFNIPICEYPNRFQRAIQFDVRP